MPLSRTKQQQQQHAADRQVWLDPAAAARPVGGFTLRKYTRLTGRADGRTGRRKSVWPREGNGKKAVDLGALIRCKSREAAPSLHSRAAGDERCHVSALATHTFNDLLILLRH